MTSREFAARLLRLILLQITSFLPLYSMEQSYPSSHLEKRRLELFADILYYSLTCMNRGTNMQCVDHEAPVAGF